MSGGLIEVAEAMGTTVTVDVRDALLDPATARRAVTAAVDLIRRADRTFSTWDPGTPMSRLRRGELSLDDAPPEIRAVLDLCARTRSQTQGWFDPWALPGGVDPTGLVKGWAAQAALDILVEHGIGHAMVNAGGDIATIGGASGEADTGWRVGIADPHRRGELCTVIHTTGRTGVATSGGYERGSLAIDPHSGQPVQRLASATVIGPDLALADAYATAASAHGPDALDWLKTIPQIWAHLLTPDGRILTTSSRQS